MVSSLVGVFYYTYELDLGASLVMNEEFFAKVFMNPLYHFSSFFLGIILGTIYWDYKEDAFSIYSRGAAAIR